MEIKVIGAELNKVFQKINMLMSLRQGQTIYTDLGKKAKDILYKRVKAGNGVSLTSNIFTREVNTDKKSFASMKNFSQSYLKFRKRHSPPGEFASPTKQNLTYTGQMLRALIFRVNKKGFTLDIDNTIRDDGKLTNNKVAEYVSKYRPFMALTIKEMDQIKSEYVKQIRQLSKKILS